MSHDLHVERWFDATPEEVFNAYTDPDAQREWYQDQPGWIVEAKCDLRAGGQWTVAFGPPGAEPLLRHVEAEPQPTSHPDPGPQGPCAGKMGAVKASGYAAGTRASS